MESGQNWYQVGNKICLAKVSKCYIKKEYLCQQAGKSSFTWRCVFYRPEHNAKWEHHGIEFWRSANAEMKYIKR